MPNMWVDKAKEVIDEAKSAKTKPLKRPQLAQMPIRYAEGGGVDAYPLTRAWSAYRDQFADGGDVEQPDMPVAASRPRFQIKSSGTAPARGPEAGAYQFMTLDEGKANTNTLKQAADRALDRHLSLPEGERIANSKAAIRALEPYLGKGKSGPISLIGSNEKLMKAKTGTKTSEPLELDDGRGVQTVGLSLYPDYREGEFKMCPNSASCRDNCLGKTSGQYSEQFTQATRNAGKVAARDRAMNRTKAMMRDPEAFFVRLWDEIESAKREATANGDHLGVRLNALSDINPIVHKRLIESHPDVSFYDYTKMGWNPVAENHHYTHSSTGADQPDVSNPYSNWRKMRRFLDRGDNVAMAFSHKKALPSFVHDEETGKRYRVVNGDEHDFRPMEIQPEGEDGVIVGLSNKDKFGKQETAHKDSNGFFVAYDPKKNGDTVYIKEQPKKGT